MLKTQVFRKGFDKLDPKISHFIKDSKEGNFFQSTDTATFYERVNGHVPILVVAYNGDQPVGSLLAVIMQETGTIKKVFSKRCVIEGGPVSNGDPKVTTLLLNSLKKALPYGVIYTEIRNFTDQSASIKTFERLSYSFEEHLNILVPVTAYDKTRQNLSSTRKRQINKSLKNGAEVVVAQNEEEIQQFYEVLSNLYKNKVGKPLADYSFFLHFFKQPELGKYFLVKLNGQVIGGIMCPIFGSTIYEWYVCGQDGQHENVFPSVLATWAPMEYAANNGLSQFDFMGAGKPDQDYGVREFKARFGGEQVNYGRFKKINMPLLYKLGEIGMKILYKPKKSN